MPDCGAKKCDTAHARPMAPPRIQSNVNAGDRVTRQSSRRIVLRGRGDQHFLC